MARDSYQYGGQAVIEGVMMRGPDRAAVAVRAADRTIVRVERGLTPPAARWPVFRLPVLRGMAALWEALTLGVWSLLWSANQSLEQEGESLSPLEAVATVALAAGLAVLLFAAAPTYLTGLVRGFLPGPVFWSNLVEGLVRIGILVAYIAAIARMKDVQRVLEYHGAEHKAINAHEAGWALEVGSVRRASRFHPRCGTSFLLYVVLVAAFLFSFFGWPGLVARIALRLALLPLVAGLAYEVLKWSSRSRSALAAALAAPGIWLQRMTTREPSDDQIEVAIDALAALVDRPAGAAAPGVAGSD